MTITGFSKIDVIGAGQMGAGIAQVWATFGLHVTHGGCVTEKHLEKTRATIGKSLGKLVSKEKVTQGDANNAWQHIGLHH